MAADALDSRVQAYFQTHCFAWYSEKSEESNFRIDAVSPKVGFENTPQWLKFMERISSGEMPLRNIRIVRLPRRALPSLNGSQRA